MNDIDDFLNWVEDNATEEERGTIQYWIREWIIQTNQ